MCSELLPFPSLSDPASRLLTVVIPAYKEQARIEKMLDELLAYLNQRSAADR